MYFIFGGIIGGSPSNSTKGDTKDCALRRDEPYITFKSSKLYMHGAVPCARLINREQY